MGAVVVVVVPPGLDHLAGMAQVREQVLVQAFVAQLIGCRLRSGIEDGCEPPSAPANPGRGPPTGRAVLAGIIFLRRLHGSAPLASAISHARLDFAEDRG